MSASLLKKSLEIVEATLPQNVPTKPNKKAQQNTKSKTKKRQSPQETNFGKAKTSTITKKTDSTTSSKLEENVRRCLLLSSAMEMDDDTAQKLIQRARSRKYVAAEAKKPKEDEPTVFTDADFEKFEREYFCS